MQEKSFAAYKSVAKHKPYTNIKSRDNDES